MPSSGRRHGDVTDRDLSFDPGTADLGGWPAVDASPMMGADRSNLRGPPTWLSRVQSPCLRIRGVNLAGPSLYWFGSVARRMLGWIRMMPLATAPRCQADNKAGKAPQQAHTGHAQRGDLPYDILLEISRR